MDSSRPGEEETNAPEAAPAAAAASAPHPINVNAPLSPARRPEPAAQIWTSAADAESLAETDRLIDTAAAAAAVQVQRLYRGYRLRRQLADIAVMARKYAWWNVVEAAVLQHTTEQFYAYNKPETARTRWARIKKKAAKVGRGLAKDDRARKLAIQHWLEAIDARHRYGHNLHPYYKIWIDSPTKEPFFYWLDVGDGKDLDLEDCPRSLLNKEQIKYLSPKERKHYEVVVEDGKLYYKTSGEPVNTPRGDKYIFVMSASGKLYVAQKEKGRFQHSSFLAGGAALAAGRLLVNDGTLELMEAHSGHYRPTEENFATLVEILTKLGADMTMAKVQSVSDDMLLKSKSSHESAECTVRQDDQVVVDQVEGGGLGEEQQVFLAVNRDVRQDDELLEEEVGALDLREVQAVEDIEQSGDECAAGAGCSRQSRCRRSGVQSEETSVSQINVINVTHGEQIQPEDGKLDPSMEDPVKTASSCAEFLKVSARSVREQVRPTDITYTATELFQFSHTKEAAELGEGVEVRTTIVHKEVRPGWSSTEGSLVASLSRLPPGFLHSNLSSLLEGRLPSTAIGGEI